MKYILRSILLITLLSACTLAGYAQRNDVDKPFQLRGGRDVQFTAPAAWADSFSASGSRQAAEVLLRFAHVPTQREQEACREAGVVLRDYLAGNVYTALISPAKGILLPPFITGIAGFRPIWKVAPALLTAKPGARISASILFQPNTTEEERNALLDAHNATLIDSKWAPFDLVEIRITQQDIATFAASPLVRAVDKSGEDQPLNWESQGATKVSIVHAPATVGGWNLKGEGMTIGVGDQSAGWNHADLKDRIKNFVVTGYANHGMHINGIVGGAGNIDYRNEGFAPRATLLDHYFSNVLAYTPTMRSDFGMSVTNNSYGNEFPADCAAHGAYNATSVATDNLILQYPEIAHVFAGGNSGLVTCSPYPAGFGTIYGSYQTAKNSIVVANMDKAFIGAADNARGPVKDGRLKPEIAAVGSGVSSTRGTDAYLTSGGTSMASPQVAAGAALLQQRYKQLFSNTLPKSLLVKNLLLNAAMDIGNAGPDYTFGYGAMNLRRSLLLLDNARYIDSSVAPNAEKTFTIAVPANTATLKVMLSWNDVAASPLSVVQLVNDLDLTVTTPASVVRKPLVLDPTPANVTLPATENEDHLNNNEQVVIQNPAAGTYTIKVKGTALPSGNRPFIVSYDLVPDSIRILHPFGSYAIRSNTPQRIYWDASPGTDTFSMQYSVDNGATWNSMVGTPAAGDRHKLWTTPDTSAPQSRLKLTRGSQTFITDPFPISKAIVLALYPDQCPGYIAMHWPPVLNATGYEVMRKKGPYMEVIATTTDTSWVYSGLSQDSLYYVSVQPLFGSIRGVRAYALIRQPNTGTCAGSYSDHDLALDAIVTPQTGRLNTSSALTASTTLTVRVRNNDDVAQSAYTVAYRLDGGGWISQAFSTPIAGASSANVSIPGLNMAAPGAHTLEVAVTNTAASDPVPVNDTLSVIVRQLQNSPIALSPGFTDDFESVGALIIQRDTAGFTPNEHWDYANTSDSARLRSFVTSEVLIGGSRSISLDLEQNLPENTNHLTGTFNLAGINPSTTEVRLQTDYKLHGDPKNMDSNAIWVRGSDVQPWIRLFQFDSTLAPGAPAATGSLSVSDALTGASQTYSSSMQVRFGQRDTSLIGANDYGNGMTLDNFALYSVTNDVSLKRIISPAGATCGLGTSTSLTVKIANGVNAAQTGVQVTYRLNNGAPVTETVPTIPAKDSITYTFTSALTPLLPGLNTLDVWVTGTSDSYHDNDSVTGYTFRNQPVISTFPYLENFEAGDGYCYSGGFRSSWAYGTPNSGVIHGAASGSKAWKTSLTGNYNDNELSYLYTPCFDISSLANPMLSFSVAMDIEDCGAVLCDGAWVEYSTNNGATWSKLGTQGTGTNWYNKGGTQQLWSQSGVNWRVASIPLPASAQVMRFRIVMASDPGTTQEGIAIDDIHIYDRTAGIYAGATTGPVSATPAANTFTSFLSGGSFLAQVNPGTSTLGTTDVTMYAQSNLINIGSQQYFLPRSFLVNSASNPQDSVTLRLFVLDSEVQTLVNATGCGTCSKPEHAYELGITQYDGSNENGTLDDNNPAGYSYHPYTKVRWVPYDNGYYAEVRVAGFSEFWFNDGGPTNSFPLPASSVDFTADKITESVVRLQWTSRIDTYVTRYEVQRSFDASTFQTFSRVFPLHSVLQTYQVYDTPMLGGAATVYYRLRYFDPAGREYFSPTRRVDWDRTRSIQAVYPNPVGAGRQFTIRWNATDGEVMDVQVTDIAGRIVHKVSSTAAGGVNNTVVSMPAAAPGAYFLKIRVGDLEDNRKLIFR